MPVCRFQGSIRLNALRTSVANISHNQESVEPSEVKTIHIGGHFPEEVHTQLKMLAIEKKMKLREVLADAFNRHYINLILRYRILPRSEV